MSSTLPQIWIVKRLICLIQQVSRLCHKQILCYICLFLILLFSWLLLCQVHFSEYELIQFVWFSKYPDCVINRLQLCPTWQHCNWRSIHIGGTLLINYSNYQRLCHLAQDITPQRSIVGQRYEKICIFIVDLDTISLCYIFRLDKFMTRGYYVCPGLHHDLGTNIFWDGWFII